MTIKSHPRALAVARMAGAGKSLTCVVAQSIPLLTGPFADLRKDTAGALGCGMLKLGHGQTLRRLGGRQGLEGFLCGDGSHLGLERCRPVATTLPANLDPSVAIRMCRYMALPGIEREPETRRNSFYLDVQVGRLTAIKGAARR
jgi:hypothetical protein